MPVKPEKSFTNKNIFVSEILPEVLKQAGLEDMLPLLPLAKGADKARDVTVNDMVNGLRAAGRDDMLALGYEFAGLVYKEQSDKRWLKRMFEMFHDMLEEFWSYWEMAQKGIGLGIEKGEVKASRSLLICYKVFLL